MTDSPDPNAWSARQIERNPEGYCRAQEAFREDREQERAKRAEADDLARFTEAFIRAVGMRSAARAAWEKRRNQRASTYDDNIDWNEVFEALPCRRCSELGRMDDQDTENDL